MKPDLIEAFQGSCPTKAFVIGEYAVLTGYPAVVAALPQRFEWMQSSSEKRSFHPESPAEVWARTHAWNHGLLWKDPVEGQGGLGGSTAEFLAVDSSLFPKADVFERWAHYQSLFKSSSNPPSGADVVAQTLGGVHAIEAFKKEARLLLEPGHSFPMLSYFHAAHLPGRKTQTHEDLGRLEHTALHSLGRLLAVSVKEGVRAFSKQDLSNLALAFEEFSEILWNAGLESRAAHEDRLYLQDLPGVLGAKGTGAQLSDGVWVLWDPKESVELRKAQIQKIQKERGLLLLQEEFVAGTPLSCEVAQ